MKPVNYGRYRVLLIPHGQSGKDAEGRGIGDDWLLATMGYFDADNGVGYDAYVTTNRVHASDYNEPDAGETAHILAAALQSHYERNR